MNMLSKRVLSLILSASLVSLLVPVPAQAEMAELEPAAEEAVDGGDVAAQGDAPETAGDASDAETAYGDNVQAENVNAVPVAYGSEGIVDEGEAPEFDEVALEVQADETSGTYYGMDWRVTSDGELILGKTGEEQTLSGRAENRYDAPWPNSITSVKVEGVVHAQGSLSYLFYGCSELTSVNLSGFDTSSATNLYAMFYRCSKLTSLVVSGWNTSSVTNMGWMFYNCSALSSLGVSGWNTASVTNMNSMFRGCSSLASLDASNWKTWSVTNMGYMFSGCSSLASLSASDWNTSSVTNMSDMFSNCSSLASLSASSWNTSAVTDMYAMFSNCSALSSLDLSGWNTSSVTNMCGVFSNCSALSSLSLSDWKTSSATDMSGMFYGCSSLASLDLSGWNTSLVTDMDDMFYGCQKLSFLDVFGWNTSSATSMGYMFSGCSTLSFLDLSGWDTSSVTDMYAMFSNCFSLAFLDLSGWDTSSVTNTNRMLSNCPSLCQIRLGEDCTKMGEFPNPRASGGKWLSEKTGERYTPSEIASQRLGIADTYTCHADSKPAGGFTDVDAYTSHFEDVLWLAAKGISTGYDQWDGTKTFGGMEPVFRQDMAAFLYRLAGEPTYVPTQIDMDKFRDVSWSTPHATAIWWLASTGISEGWDMHDGTFTFRPKDTVKRQDMAAFLRRLARRMGADADSSGAANPFRDVTARTDHYEDILWLASTGVTKGWDMGDGTFEYRGMDSVKRQDMAAFLHRLDTYIRTQ